MAFVMYNWSPSKFLTPLNFGITYAASLSLHHLHHSPVEGYVPFPEEHLTFELWSPIGRKGHSPSRKGYIVVQSDRDPTKEV